MMKQRIATRTRQPATSRHITTNAAPSLALHPEPGKVTAFVAHAEQEILAVTHWFMPVASPHPYLVTVTFTGRRLGVVGRKQPHDHFIHYETIADVVPGSGPIALTAQIRDIHPGRWEVTACVQPSGVLSRTQMNYPKPAVALPVSQPDRLIHMWQRWSRSVGAEEPTEVMTCLAPLARTPGTFLGAWFGFVVIGIILALTMQSVVMAQTHFAVGPVWTVRIVGLMAGFVVAKGWFLAKHGREGRWEGWCIQGFVTGITLAVVGLLIGYHIAVGNYLDTTVPGLLMGMAVGRIGCFFGGCCGGPPTAAWWGVWSSDQRVGARRVPTQLLEAGFTGCLWLLTWVIVVSHGLAHGAIFIAGIALYTLGRQGVLRLRADAPSPGRHGWIVTVVAALLALAAGGFIIVQ